MPALRVFNRRTFFAGDDLQPTAIINACFRAFQFFFLVLPVLIHLINETKNFINLAEKENINFKDESAILSYLFGGDVYPVGCSSGSQYFPLLLYSYLFITSGHILLSLAMEYVIYKISCIGTPTQPEMRYYLGKIIEKKWIWLNIVANVILMVFVTLFFHFKDLYFECRELIFVNGDDDQDIKLDLLARILGKRAWWVLLILVIASQSMQGIVNLVTLGKLLRKEKAVTFVNQTHYDDDASVRSSSRYDMDDYEHSLYGPRYTAHHHELAEEMWTNRCENFCKCAAFSTCYLFGGRDLVDGVGGDYAQISRALADYFEDGGVLDLVASDLAVGFVMLQRVQRQRILEARRRIHQDIMERMEVVSSTRSALSDDAHNFAMERSDRKIQSVLDEDEPFKYQNSLRNLNQDSDLNQASNRPPIVTNMLDSAVQPALFSRPLFLHEGTSGWDQLGPNEDINSALILRMSSNRDNQDSSHWYEAQTRKVLQSTDEFEKNLIAEGARFARHSLAIYTWLLYFYMHPFTGIPRLIAGRLVECCRRDDNSEYFKGFNAHAHSQTIGDNWLHVHKNALMAHSGLDNSDLVYANFENRYNQMPYAIIIDHKWQSVVIAIRGTLSLEDCVVDVLVDPEPLEDIGRNYHFNAEGQYCHSGVLACVRHIMKDLERHNILETLLLGVGAPYSHYNLRLTGHSLGAGCATLLGYMFRHKFPDLKVIAISPPGGFITWRLATECKEFVTTFVLDSDLVPRLSVASMELVRNEVLDLVSRIKVNKIEVAKLLVIGGISNGIKEIDDPAVIARENSTILHPKENDGSESNEQTEFRKQLQKFETIQKQRKEKRGEMRDIQLFPPGKMIHLVKTGENSSCMNSVAKCVTCCTSNVGYKYSPVWADNSDFNEIVVSPTMAFDHFPNRVCLQLESVAASFGIDTAIGSSAQDREKGDMIRNNYHSPF